MTTFITEQVGAMRFDRAKGSHHLSHGRIHIHGQGREPDFINLDHFTVTLVILPKRVFLMSAILTRHRYLHETQ